MHLSRLRHSWPARWGGRASHDSGPLSADRRCRVIRADRHNQRTQDHRRSNRDGIGTSVRVAGLLSTDGAFAAKMLDEAYADRERIQILRTTTTAINDPAAIAQTIRFYRVNAGVELMGVSTPSEGYIYSPALLLLPADVHAGSHWTGAGSAGATLDYRSELQADAVNSDCLRVTGQVRYLSKAGQLGRVVTVAQTWCPREGILAENQSYADVRIASSRIDPPPPSVQTTTNAAIHWTAPEHWTTKAFTTISVNPTFGEGPMVGSPAAVTPVRTESDLVIRATLGRGDLVATTPKTPTAWTSVWRGHPGGTIMTPQCLRQRDHRDNEQPPDGCLL